MIVKPLKKYCYSTCLCLLLITAWTGIFNSYGDNWIIRKISTESHGNIGPISVSADANDGQVGGPSALYYGSGENSDGVGWAGYFSGSLQYVFFSFTLSAAIPAGTSVTNAIVEIYGRDQDTWDNGVDDLRISLTDAADAPVISTYAARPAEAGGSTTITTVVSWDNVTWNTAGFNTSANISSIINELVTDYSGLANGAKIGVWVRGVSPTAHFIGVELNEHSGSNPARLTIQW